MGVITYIRWVIKVIKDGCYNLYSMGVITYIRWVI